MPSNSSAQPRETLLDVLRNRLGLTGAKEGCGTGDCGACSVTVDGRLVCSCLVLGAEAEGREVTTVEGLSTGGKLHALQTKFIEHAALQCGICTPGFLVSAKALLDRNSDPSEEEIRYALAGNLCRCTGYDKIVRAVSAAAKEIDRSNKLVRCDVDRRDETTDEAKSKWQHDTTFTNQEFKIVGTRPPRPDGVDKVTGRARYGADASAPGQLVGLILRSPHAHAKIKKIDTSKAEKLKGVKAIITSADLPDLTKGDRGMLDILENCMARGRALYDGHAVAAVAAIDAETAREALKLIKVDYQVLPHVTDVDEAMKPNAPIVQPHIRTAGVEPTPTNASNVSQISEFGHGDVEAGFAQADVIDRAQLQDRADPPGLHRTARVPRKRRPRRPGRTVGHHAGPLHVPQPVRQLCSAWTSRS